MPLALKRLLVIGSCGLSAAAPLIPGTARCLRVADHDFNRIFADQLDGSGNAGRKSTKSDCDHACNNADSEHSSWCIGFEFRDTEKGTCELYDDCSTDSPAPSPVVTAQEAPAKEAQAAPAPSPVVTAQEAPAKEAQAAPAKVERCLRVSDHDFNALFADQLDGSGNAGRKSTKSDCDHACNNADSEHSSWCIGFEFRDTEKGMCELYEDCSKKADTPASSETAKEHSTPFAAQAAQTASPNVKSEHRCLRVATSDFDTFYDQHIERRYSWGGRDPRETVDTDCEHLCTKATEGNETWCVGYEFTRDGNGTCELYDDCSKKGDSPASSPVVTAQEAPAKEAQAAPAKAAPAKAAPAKVERCLRVSDHDFNALFADQLDGSGNAGRKSTKSDCDHACNNADSEHSSWCIGFEFRDTEKGMCELYEDCSKKADTPAPSETAQEHSTPFAAEAAQAAPAQEKPAQEKPAQEKPAQEKPAQEKPAQEKPAQEKPAQQASLGVGRCLRVSDHEFDSSFSKQGSGNGARKGTKEDCSKLCFDESSDKHNWCVGFEFRDTEKGTCELYDECAPEVAKERKEAAAKEAAAKAAPAEKLQMAPSEARCLRVSDNDFNRWFVEHYDKSGHKPGRKSTAEDCSHVCSDASSEHHSWCVGFEFKDTEKGTCELYEGCTQQQAQQSHQQQG